MIGVVYAMSCWLQLETEKDGVECLTVKQYPKKVLCKWLKLLKNSKRGNYTRRQAAYLFLKPVILRFRMEIG
jgi:hypothetical protein